MSAMRLLQKGQWGGRCMNMEHMRLVQGPASVRAQEMCMSEKVCVNMEHMRLCRIVCAWHVQGRHLKSNTENSHRQNTRSTHRRWCVCMAACANWPLLPSTLHTPPLHLALPQCLVCSPLSHSCLAQHQWRCCGCYEW